MSSGKVLNDKDYSELADFRYALRRFLAFSEARAAEAGLTPQQHQALLAIRGAPAGSATVGYVAERLVLKPHSATGLIDRLEALGLVTRSTTQQDRRRAVLSLGSRAEDILASLSEVHWQEIERLKPVLQHMLHGFGAEHYAPPARTSAGERADKRRQRTPASATRRAGPRAKAHSAGER